MLAERVGMENTNEQGEQEPRPRTAHEARIAAGSAYLNRQGYRFDSDSDDEYDALKDEGWL